VRGARDAGEGLADREHAVTSRLGSRFVIGSLSKQITAALVMQQVDREKSCARGLAGGLGRR
jgi:CubicO group peptidase (beta-lactamase class C family)